MKRLKFVVFSIAVAMLISPVSMAELRAGIAKADVTPPVGGAMYGYGARGSNVSEGVHDPLFAKALVLDDGETSVAIVTLDLGSFTDENTANVRRLVADKVEIDSILLVASHTHSSPRASENFPTSESPWIREAESKIAAAIIDAAKNTQPAQIGIGWGEVSEGHNRRMITTDGRVVMKWGNRDREPTSPVDYSLAVIRVQDKGGKTLANLINFACHPVVLGPENLLISADFVGYLGAAVEKELGGQCMYMQGAAGDINPFWDKTPPEDGGFEEAEKMGLTMAAEVIRVSSGISSFEDAPTLGVSREVVALASRNDREREERETMAEINALLIGEDIALATFPGEFFVEHGLSLKARSQFENTLFVGYTNGAWGYFPTVKACTEGGYGAASATRVEVGAGERLVNRALVNLYYLADRIHP